MTDRRPLRVLFVITKSNWGGAQRYVYDLAIAAHKRGFEVAVALGGTGEAGASPGSLATRLRETGIRTIFVRSFMRDVSLSKEASALGELVEIFKREKPDVVHLNSSKAGGLGALAARIAGVPRIIFTVHGLPWDEPRGIFAKAAIYSATRATFLLCHAVITISRDNYERARACLLCRHKIHLIYNGINLRAPLGSGASIRDTFPAGVRITGTIGELNKNKNQIALIEEARKMPDMYVAIVGEGEERAYLEAKIREYGLESRVKLFGFLPASEVLRGFDEFVLPSKKEGLPYVVLEARAAGVPVRGNRVGGVSEALDLSLEEFSLEQMAEKTFALYLS